MNSKRLRMILLACLGSMALFFVLNYAVGMSLLSKKSQKMVSLKSENKALEAQLISLAQAKREVQQYSYFKDVAKSVIPNDKDQAQAVIDIIRMANESGIVIQSITFPSSTLGGPLSATPAQGAAAAAPNTAASATSQAKAVPGIAGLYSLELTIAPSVSPDLPANKRVTYPKMIDFLQRIERNRRTAQIINVNIEPPKSSEDQTMNFTLIINIFMKP